MKKKYNKRYLEIYAMLTLSKYLNLDLDIENLKERPDLQSKELDIGIEVTQAITEQDGLYNALYQQYFGKGYKSKYIKKMILKNKRFTGQIYEIDGKVYIAPSDETISADSYLEKLENSILKKLRKLTQGYTLFSSNCLYLYTNTYLLKPEDIYRFFSKLDTSEFKLQFDIYYINCIDKIYLFNKNNHNFKEYDINIKDLPLIRKKALKLSKKFN